MSKFQSTVPMELQNLQKDILRRKVEHEKSRCKTDELSGGKLWLRQMVFVRDGIQALHPSWDAEQVESEIQRRLALKRRIDDAGLYKPADSRSQP